MIAWASAAPPLLASFMASTVECVEALTIVLAVGVVRGWRSALTGTLAGIGVLLLLVLAFGSSLGHVPLPALQIVVGTLLLMFGLRWLRKAVLRAAGVLALHDEEAAYAQEADAMRERSGRWWRGIDVVAFLATFKAVVLEGVEVVFIVIAIGAGGRMLVPAAAGAALALAAIVVLGIALRRPLSNVPENALKFGVGAMLSAFGCFWVGEGLGLPWMGGDLAVIALIAVFALAALVLVSIAGRLHARALLTTGSKAALAKSTPRSQGLLASLGGELLGLFVDDGWLAAGIVLLLAAAGLAIARFGAPRPVEATAVLVASLIALLSASALRRAAA